MINAACVPLLVVFDLDACLWDPEMSDPSLVSSIQLPEAERLLFGLGHARIELRTTQVHSLGRATEARRERQLGRVPGACAWHSPATVCRAQVNRIGPEASRFCGPETSGIEGSWEDGGLRTPTPALPGGLGRLGWAGISFLWPGNIGN